MCSVNNVKVSILLLVLSIASTSCSPLGNNRIFGGKEATAGQFPYHISLRNEKNFHRCSGSILSQKFVVTAAHCLYEKKPESCFVFVDAHSHFDGQAYGLKSFLIHEEYDEDEFINDIALIELRQPIKFSSNMAPIELSREFIEGGLDAVIYGWGDTDDSNDNLKFVHLTTLTLHDCQKSFKPTFGVIDLTTLCAYSGTKGKGICNGDSGGPLVHNGRLIGITSWGTHKCAVGRPDGFTRVSRYFDWIERTMASVAARN